MNFALMWCLAGVNNFGLGRKFRNAFVVLGVVAVFWAIGTAGYHSNKKEDAKYESMICRGLIMVLTVSVQQVSAIKMLIGLGDFSYALH